MNALGFSQDNYHFGDTEVKGSLLVEDNLTVSGTTTTGAYSASSIISDDIKNNASSFSVDVNGDVVANNLTVNGTQTIINSQTLQIVDPIIEVAKSNVLDWNVGIVGDFTSGTLQNRGMIFDKATDKWIFYDNEPDASKPTATGAFTPTQLADVECKDLYATVIESDTWRNSSSSTVLDYNIGNDSLRASKSFIPTSNTYNLGAASSGWNNIYVRGAIVNDATATLGTSGAPFDHIYGDNFTVSANGNVKWAASTNTISIGTDALAQTGTTGIAIGTNALSSNNSSGDVQNIAVGTNAMQFAGKYVSKQSRYNISMGYEAFRGSDVTYTSCGDHNISMGYQAVSGIGSPGIATSCDYNVGIGYRALYSITGPSSSIYGYSNTAVGTNALLSMTTGRDNVALGSDAGTTLTTGNYNIAIGKLANIGATVEHSISIGRNSQCTGDSALALGYSASCTGANSIALGTSATAAANQMVIGGSSSQITSILPGTDAVCDLGSTGKKWGDLHTSGAVYNSKSTVVSTSTATIGASDHIMLVDYTSTGACTIDLPSISSAYTGFAVIVKDSGSNASNYNITVRTSGGVGPEYIDFSSNHSVVINIDSGSLRFYCDGTNWFIL